MILLLALACRSTELTVDSAPDDTAVTDDTAGTDDTGDSGEETKTPDYSRYEASLTYFYDGYGETYDCEDEMPETGYRLKSGRDYEALKEACPLCTHFYEVDRDEVQVCDSQYLEIQEEFIRGFQIGNGAAVAYVFEWNEDREVYEPTLIDNNVHWDGWSLELEYVQDLSYGEYQISGEIRFEAAE